MDTSIGDAAAPDPGFQLLRVKRRRHATVAEQLILHELAVRDEGKRQRTEGVPGPGGSPGAGLAQHMGRGLSLGGTQDVESSAAGVPVSGGPEPLVPGPQVAGGGGTARVARRQRYVRVETLHKDALKGLAAGELNQMVHRWKQAATTRTPVQPQPDQQQQQQQQQQQEGIKGPKGMSVASPASAQAAQAPLRYTAVRGKRPLSSLIEPTSDEMAQDAVAKGDTTDAALNGAHHAWRVLDIHALHPDQDTAAAPPDKKRLRAEKQQAVSQQQRELAAKQEEEYQRALAKAGAPGQVESLLKAHFLPMLDDFLTQAGENIGQPQPPDTVTPAEPAAPSSTLPASAVAGGVHQYKLPQRRRGPVATPAQREEPYAPHATPTHEPDEPYEPFESRIPMEAEIQRAEEQLEQLQAANAATTAAAGQQQQPQNALPDRGPMQEVVGGMEPCLEGMSADVVPKPEIEGVMSEEDEDLVYDVYLPVDEEEEGKEILDRAMRDAGTNYDLPPIPVIEVPDSDDEELWAAQHEVPGAAQHPFFSLEDTEDSNAESFYANTYPDEEGPEEFTSDEDMGESRRRMGGGWGGGGGADDEEYDVDEYDSQGEATEGLDAVTASRHAAQGFLKAALAARGKSGTAGAGLKHGRGGDVEMR